MYILAESFRGYTLKASERDLPEQEGLMKFYLISDNVDTLMGMHLAGINGVVVHELKLNRKQPLIVEIPDRHGSGRAKDSITRYVREAIGVKI